MTQRWETSFPEPYDGREDNPGRGGHGPSGIPHRCITCGWQGKGPAVYDHHCENPAHQIVLRDAPQWGPVSFGCCHELAQPAEQETEP
jgi:hypothetical protein